MLLRGARLARRLCSRAGPAEAALSRAPPLLRYLKILINKNVAALSVRSGLHGEGARNRSRGVRPPAYDGMNENRQRSRLEGVLGRAMCSSQDSPFQHHRGVREGLSEGLSRYMCVAVSGFRSSGQIISALQNVGIDSPLKLSRLEGKALEDVQARLQANHRRGSRLVHKIVPDLVIAAQEALENSIRGVNPTNGWWIVSVPELQAAGHFPALTPRQREYIISILALDAECPPRVHPPRMVLVISSKNTPSIRRRRAIGTAHWDDPRVRN